MIFRTKVLVTGSRRYTDRVHVFAVLDAIRAEKGELHIIHGDQTGADEIALEWARARYQLHSGLPANWPKHGKPAGPIRNADMLNEFQPELVVAFPGGKGTSSMKNLAIRAGVPVHDAAVHQEPCP
jgi:hypothetical protein